MTPKQLYRGMIRHHDWPWCWACGRGSNFASKPRDWHGPWWVERSHIVNKPRVQDRRLVVLLCSLCHANFHGERIVTRSRPLAWPKLTRAHLLWLKRVFDPEYFDLDFLQGHAVGQLPEPERLPDEYLRAHLLLRGHLPEGAA